MINLENKAIVFVFLQKKKPGFFNFIHQDVSNLTLSSYLVMVSSFYQKSMSFTLAK